MKRFKSFLPVLCLSVVLAMSMSCKKDKDDETNNNNNNQNQTVYNTGVLIANEGVYQAGNASVSHYDPVKNVLTNSLFETINSRPLGDVLQSVLVTGGKAYMVLNVSNKIEIVTLSDFKESAVISNLNSPRHLLPVSTSKAYLTEWGDNAVKVIDLASNSITGTINVGSGPEKMLMTDESVYVANGGGWGTDSTVSVISTSSDQLTATIGTGISPMDIVKDHEGYIWVLCKGAVQYDSLWNLIGHDPSVLQKIDPGTNTIISTTQLSEDQHPEHLEISPDGTTLYYGAGTSGFSGIYSISTASPSVSTTAFITGTYYGFNVNPVNGEIYALNAGDYQTNGTLYRYNSSGTVINSHTVGLIPNSVVFID
ncbi:MAG: hypothetical protein KJ607_11310 [Bacteroidetes bacterium]|nr:hypothetical protein [Bacteroidota bacterium]